MRRWLPDQADAMVLMGSALVIVGVAMWSRPAAMVVAGGALIAFAVKLGGGRRGSDS